MKWSDLTAFAKIAILLLFGGIVYAGLYFFGGVEGLLGTAEVDEISVDTKVIDNVEKADMLSFPTSMNPSTTVRNKPAVNISAYRWNAQQAIIGSIGGPVTMQGSVMEANGVNISFTPQDWLSELQNRQLSFIDQYHNGKEYPTGDASFGIIMMGDGAAYYVSVVNQLLENKYNGKYHVEVVGHVGMSYGEDKLIGPVEWKFNPQKMRGAVISTVPGDGDWVTTVNYASANGIPINRDHSTWHPDAINIFPSKNDDYIESALELIASQTSGYTEEFIELDMDGKPTGNKVRKKIDGCATWTPGDKKVFDALTGFTDIASTKEFNNQMPTTLIVVKEWAQAHSDVVVNVLKSSYTVANQMKQYDEWRRYTARTIHNTYQVDDTDPDFWYDMFDGISATKNGIPYNMGGSKVLTLADAKQYNGLGSDGLNRYKSVWDQTSNYLTTLSPMDFNKNVKRVVSYEEGVNLSYLRRITGIDEGVVETVDYTRKATTTFATGEWNVTFDLGRATLRPEGRDVLDQVYNLIIQAEGTKLDLVGHTDSTGNRDSNYSLSDARAQAVKTYLMSKGAPASRFQKVIGRGQDEPLVDPERTAADRARNRRVTISLFN